MRKSAESPTDAASAFKVDRALRRSMPLVSGFAAILTIERRSARSTSPRNRDRKDPPLVPFHFQLLKTGGADQLIHLGGRAPAHDPWLAFPVPQNPRNEFHLRMPGLVRINEMAAWFDCAGQAAQRGEHLGVRR